MKKRGSEGGSEGALLDERANKYEKPFNGLRTGPNTFLPNCTRSESTNPIPYMPEIHIVLGHILPPSRSLLVHYLINYYTRITKIPSFLTFQMRIKTYASIQTHLGISIINNGSKTGVGIRIHGRVRTYEPMRTPYGLVWTLFTMKIDIITVMRTTRLNKGIRRTPQWGKLF